MLFLVSGQNLDPGYLLPPDQTIAVLEQAVVPSFQILAQWAKDGRVKGGTFVGERAGAFVVEAASFEELDDLMNQLPFYGLVSWEVKPLIPFESVARQLPQYLQRSRQMQQGQR